MFNQKIKRREEVLMFNEMNIKDMLCDMYDIRRKTKQAKLFNAPKDNDGSCITVGECIDNVIDQLSEELKRRGESL